MNVLKWEKNWKFCSVYLQKLEKINQNKLEIKFKIISNYSYMENLKLRENIFL